MPSLSRIPRTTSKSLYKSGIDEPACDITRTSLTSKYMVEAKSPKQEERWGMRRVKYLPCDWQHGGATRDIGGQIRKGLIHHNREFFSFLNIIKSH